MRKIWTALVIACLVTPLLAGTAGAKAPPKLTLTISNFRFCKAAECGPQDSGYARSSSGPVADNPFGGSVDVKSGTLVTWVYKDGSCDGISGCPGHNIYFENGYESGVKKGFVPARKGPKAINVRITQSKGTTIRYFCSVNGHYMYGMTGILHVI
jgi:hypothetical protein